MEIPFISAYIRKRRFKRKIKSYRAKLDQLRTVAVTQSIGFNWITERFYCETCGQQICGKNPCNAIIPIVIHLQKDYDHWKEQIYLTEARYDHDVRF